MAMKKRRRAAAAGAVVILLLAAGYLSVMYFLDQSPALNFAVVDPGRLMRSSQPKPGDLDQIMKEHGLGTIICLRGKGEYDERLWAREHGVKMVIMQMYAADPPSDAQVGIFFDIMRGDTVDLEKYGNTVERVIGFEGSRAKFPFPVLIHCEGGADRTGVMSALYRMAFQGWSVEQAEEEMVRRRHLPPVHPALFQYLEKTGPSVGPDYGSRSR